MVCAALLLLSSTCGCSFIFVRTPPSGGQPNAGVGSRSCTSSKLAPALDTVFGGLQLVRTGLAASAPDSTYESKDAPLSREADVALGVGFATLFVSSAIYGFVNTAECSSRHHREDEGPPRSSDPPETWQASTPSRPAVAPPPATVTPAPTQPPAANGPAPPMPAAEPSSEPEPEPAPGLDQAP